MEPALCACCDQPATLRCSKCRTVGLNVPYCSGAHQKQVWCTHKLTCGRVVHDPFTTPPITRLEWIFYIVNQRHRGKEEVPDGYKAGPGGWPEGGADPNRLELDVGRYMQPEISNEDMYDTNA